MKSMNANVMTTAGSTGSASYADLIGYVSRRIMDGGAASYEDAMLLAQAAGAMKYLEMENRRLRDEAQAERLRKIRSHRQVTPSQQQQGQPELWFQAWADDFDAFLATPDGEAWLEQQADVSRDPYCI